VRVILTLDDGTTASASVPSGASTGEHEAVELRDGDKSRFGGKGVLKAVSNVNDLIAPRLFGFDPARQAEIDGLLLHLDDSPEQGAARGERHPWRIDGCGACGSASI
jgi:enolase 1/2/3